jgi:adenylate cyclase
MQAYDSYLKGMAHLRLWTPDDLVKAIKYFEEAVEIDPNYGQGYTALADAYVRNIVGGKEYWVRTNKFYDESQIFIRHYIDLAMKNPVPKTFALLARSEGGFLHFSKAVQYAEKAIDLAPNDADVLFLAGKILSFVGKPQKALKCFKKSNVLDPLNRSTVMMVIPYFILKQYEKAVDSFEKSIPNVRELLDTLLYAAASYAYLSRKKEAKATLDKWINMTGGIDVNRLYSGFPHKDPEVFDRLMKGLVKAGMEGSIPTTIKINKKFKLTRQEIKALMFGKTEAFGGHFYEKFFHRKENGEVSYQEGDTIKKGISWIKDDMLCNKFDEIAGGCDDCADIYRNPLGEYAFQDEY